MLYYNCYSNKIAIIRYDDTPKDPINSMTNVYERLMAKISTNITANVLQTQRQRLLQIPRQKYCNHQGKSFCKHQ